MPQIVPIHKMGERDTSLEPEFELVLQMQRQPVAFAARFLALEKTVDTLLQYAEIATGRLNGTEPGEKSIEDLRAEVSRLSYWGV